MPKHAKPAGHEGVAQPGAPSPWPLVSAIFTCFFAGALYGWSALIAPLQNLFNLSMGDTGLAFSLAIVSFTLAVLAAPFVLHSRSSPRQIAVLALLGAGCVLLAMRAPSYAMFLLWFSGGFGAASGAIYCVALAIAAQSPTRGIATPVMVASFGAGGAVFGPLWRVLGAEWGLGGLIFLACGLAVSSCLSWGVDARSHAETRPLKTPPPATTEIKRLVLLWLLFAFGSYTGLMVLGMAAKMMDAAGLGLGLASATLAGIAVCNTAGRLSAAYLNASQGVQGCVVVAFCLMAMGIAATAFAPTWAPLYALGLMTLATSYGLVASTLPLITQVVFGPAAFQARFAVIFTAWGVAGFCAPWSAGLLYDLSGSFDLALICSAASTVGFGAIAFVLVQHLGKDAATRQR